MTLLNARAKLAERLRGRWGEIESAAMIRLYDVAEPKPSSDPEYAEGLRTAASAALSYLLDGVQFGESRPPQLPDEVLAQARRAARNDVPLDTVLRRCFAGHALFGDFLVQEAEDSELLDSAAMRRLLRAQASRFDRLVAAVTEEYTREADNRPGSAEERRAELVERLLAGEPLETSRLPYDFGAHHLGAIAKGEGAPEALRELARALDRRLLLIRRPEDTAWAWFGGLRVLDPEELGRLLAATWPPDLSLAIGEPGEGLGGWRLSHRQAHAALPVALRGPEPVTRYADVALLAAILQDELFATSLRELYLKPLEAERDGGEVARETLRAYFAAERNVSSAAMALGVNRNTVASRLRMIEQRLDRPLDCCAVEFEVALRLEGLEAPLPPPLRAIR